MFFGLVMFALSVVFTIGYYRDGEYGWALALGILAGMYAGILLCKLKDWADNDTK